MNLDKLIKTGEGCGMEYISFIVLESVGEYSLDRFEYKFPHTTIRNYYDGNKLEEYLGWAHPIMDQDKIEKLMNTALESCNKEAKQQGYNICEFDHEIWGDLISIVIWKPTEKSLEQNVKEFLALLSIHILDLWSHRGADDDYYDYLPSATDVLFQLCRITEANDVWDKFMKHLLKIEWSGEPDDSESDPREQCLYRYKL